MQNLGSFSISAAQSETFAAASGDRNPLHIDPVAARRTQFGATLVHGIHGALCALDMLLAARGRPASLQSLRVKFPQPISQDQVVDVSLASDADQHRLELRVGERRCQIIDLALVDTDLDEGDFSGASGDALPGCRELGIAAAGGLAEEVPLLWQEVRLRELFPHVTRLLPGGQVASLLSSTFIVGMRCPGLNSIYATLELSAPGPSGGDVDNLAYRVDTADERINRVEMSVLNRFVRGRIEAFFRPPPVSQAGIEQIAALVPAGEFAGQDALVVGGSRGLGEVICKVLAAGGARVTATYATGAEDAEAVTAEIIRAGGEASCHRYDVCEGALDGALAQGCRSFSHVYYMASPHIERGDPATWDEDLFQRYRQFYVLGLQRLIESIQRSREEPAGFTLFVPSSIFLEEQVRGFAEYVAAKEEAEHCVAQLAARYPGLRTLTPRLPRLHTDQTSGVRGADTVDTPRVIYEALSGALGAHGATRS